MQYITKDVSETLDYVFVRNVEDNIVNVSYTQDNAGGLVVNSCVVNVNVITDSNGVQYPSGRAIVLWVSGGTVGAKEKVIITYTTAGGRTRDEAVIFTLIQEN
jgi:hypothetical protein